MGVRAYVHACGSVGELVIELVCDLVSVCVCVCGKMCVCGVSACKRGGINAMNLVSCLFIKSDHIELVEQKAKKKKKKKRRKTNKEKRRYTILIQQLTKDLKKKQKSYSPRIDDTEKEAVCVCVCVCVCFEGMGRVGG